MNDKSKRPSAEELASLTAYLTEREHSLQPKSDQPNFPGGLAGDLLKLAETTQPDPAFAARLELQLRQASQAPAKAVYPGWLSSLWQSFSQPERKTTMKRLIAFALIGIVILAVVWVSLPSLFPPAGPTQIVVATPPTQTPAPTPLSPLTPTAIPPTPKMPVAINFTPQPLPGQAPSLPSLEKALGAGYGGSGGGNLPQPLPISLATELPASPAEVTAYYRLESTPLTLDEANQIASRWGLTARFYMPGWMENITPDQIERSYIAMDGMQNLSMWNSELSFTDLSIFPVFGGHQYPQSGLPPAEQAVTIATQYLTERGYLDYEYTVSLNTYSYGLVNFYRVMNGIPVTFHAASVKIDPQGQVGSVWINREAYQSVGTYPMTSAQSAWELLAAGQPSDQISISYYPTQDGNPQYWGRVYPAGKTAQLFGAPTYLPAAEAGASPYVQLNNLVLVGDVSGLLEYLHNQGYIHAWGEVQEVDGTRQLQLAGWEPFDEFSGYFDGTVRRTAEGDFLELSDGRMLKLPDLPADVPADIPLYAQGGLVSDSLEWFILQVHPASEGQLPSDLSLAQAVIDKVELVYLAPPLNDPTTASDPAYRMLIPAWSFSGHLTDAGGYDLVFQAYVQAVANP